MEGVPERSIKKQKGEFEVEITLKQEGHADIVLIRVTDAHRFSRFHLHITEDEL